MQEEKMEERRTKEKMDKGKLVNYCVLKKNIKIVITTKTFWINKKYKSLLQTEQLKEM